MLSKKLIGMLNAQITLEFASAWSYLSMAAWFESRNLPGSAAWMRRQSREEAAHGMKIFEFLVDRDAPVTLEAVPKPALAWKDAQDLWEKALAHEQKVTASLARIHKQALADEDYPTQVLMQWFATEQVEEEKTARSILEQVTLVKPNSSAMFFVDRHLGKDAEG
jgi:ferritin